VTPGSDGTRYSTVVLRAGAKRTGEPVHEEVLVQEVRDDVYRVVATPAFVSGIAAGDEIRVDGDTFELESRTDNVAVRFYADPNRSADVTPLTQALETLGGRLDGHHKYLWVYTVPRAAGLHAIARVVEAFRARNPGSEWEYGNADTLDGERRT
jgi:hypothetical protein